MTDTNEKIFCLLEQLHKNAKCELKFDTPFQLLVAVVLSAQCTDKRVNMVTKELFRVAKTPQDFVKMPIKDLEKWIFSCGFYHNKARAIKLMSDSVCTLGDVPSTREELMALAGVGRKTANVVLSVAFGKAAIAVDTHVFRVANRLGLANASSVGQTEQQLEKAFESDKWSQLHHLLIFHGRYICHSQNPNCEECSVNCYCKYFINVQK